jgi:hypothetical protein
VGGQQLLRHQTARTRHAGAAHRGWPGRSRRFRR